MESSPEESLIDNFNPFDSAAPVQGMGATGLVYEPLYEFNLANPSAAPYPWLATAYSWGDGGKSITFTIRQGVKWNDGQPMTADDVAFTFNYDKQYANSKTDNINLGGLQISNVTESGNTVTVSFPKSALDLVQGDIDASGPPTLEHGTYVFSTGTAADSVTQNAADSITL